MANGPTLNVIAVDEPGLVGSIFGGVDLTWAVLFIGLLILLASVLMIALRSGGSNTTYLHETDDYWEDEDEVNLLPSGAKEEVPDEFPLDYRDQTVRNVMAQYGITDTIAFLQHARGFDKDGNEYLNKSELQQAAGSFVAAGSMIQAQDTEPQSLDPSTMTPEQLEWYEQAKQWGGYYDEAGNWIPL